MKHQHCQGTYILLDDKCEMSQVREHMRDGATPVQLYKKWSCNTERKKFLLVLFTLKNFKKKSNLNLKVLIF